MLLVAVSGCGSDEEQSGGHLPRVRVVVLPGATAPIDFDDIVYSRRLRRIVVPARHSGLYLVDPQSAKAKRLGPRRSIDSADEGRGLIFALRRAEGILEVVDARSGRVISSTATGAAGDYVRYVQPTGELWVTKPGASPPGIEIFALRGRRGTAPRRVGFVPVPGGAEGLAWSASRRAAYTHAGTTLARIDLRSRRVTARWRTGCSGTHGFPRVDERGGLLVGSCSKHGEVVLLDLDDGHEVGRYAVGGGEALPAYSSRTGHFYVRSDPGTKIATLAASRRGFTLADQVRVPKLGHCLTADELGHYWTCDAERGRILRFDDR